MDREQIAMTGDHFHEKVFLLFIGAICAALTLIGIFGAVIYARHEAKQEHGRNSADGDETDL